MARASPQLKRIDIQVLSQGTLRQGDRGFGDLGTTM
jgi:hypothetical protein